MGFNPVKWVSDAADDLVDAGETVVDATVSGAEAVGDAVVDVSNSVVDTLVDAGEVLASTGSTVCSSIAGGAVATFNTASGGVVYAVDWTATEATKVGQLAAEAAGDIAHFEVELYGNMKGWAEDAWKYLSQYVMSSPPSLGGYDDLARDFIKALLTVYLYGDQGAAESVVKSWERDARKKGYTMAIDLNGSAQIANISASFVNGVYVDDKGKWGFFSNFGVSATLTLDASVSLTMDLYMLFGSKSMYEKSYYFVGGSVDIEGFIVGGDVLLTSGFGFAGFQVTLGVGVSYELFSSGGNASAKSAGASSKSVSASATLPSLDIYSVDLLGEKGATTDVACQVAASSSDEATLAASASGAMTLKSSSILLSEQVGGTGGGAFSDDVTNVERIQSVTIYTSGSHVSRIAIKYQLVDGSTVTTSHGGSGGAGTTLTLADDEYITTVEGRAGSYLDYLSIGTSNGQRISAGGSGGGSFSISPQVNRPIIGIFGRSGSLIDALGVYYRSGRPFTLKAKSSGLLLDVSGQMSAGAGASTVQQASTGGPSQQWLLAPGTADGEYLLVNQHSGLCLEVSGTAEGAAIVQNDASGSDHQVWELVSDSGTCFIKNKGTGLYMDVEGGSAAAGATVLAWGLNKGNNQRWRLTPAPTRVHAYSGGGFTGSFQAFGPGRHDLSALTIGNDTIRSIQVPEGWRVTLYSDAHFAGSSQVLTRDAAELASMSGKVSSLVVEMPPWGAKLYTDAGYSGSSIALRPGRYASLSSLGFKNDALSSVEVPSGWRVTLYSDEGFGGTVTVLTSSARDLKDQGVNDVASSVVVEESPLGQVVLYKDYRFQGTAQALGPGKYDMSSLTAAGGVGNDKVSSIKVPPRWTVVLCQDSGFSGATKTLTADCSRLDDFNDTTSSLIVIPG
ncbi:RICIN domain-containing protein [Sorangium sp. So ce1099]|uniref:RICIN domain-containing protein n=1 Tax=Sorangium sp. So ce1099 TaxID=3133331 RepID=UPI003F62FA7E